MKRGPRTSYTRKSWFDWEVCWKGQWTLRFRRWDLTTLELARWPSLNLNISFDSQWSGTMTSRGLFCSFKRNLQLKERSLLVSMDRNFKNWFCWKNSLRSWMIKWRAIENYLRVRANNKRINTSQNLQDWRRRWKMILGWSWGKKMRNCKKPYLIVCSWVNKLTQISKKVIWRSKNWELSCWKFRQDWMKRKCC